MPVVEVVWRHLLVGARAGRRRWPSITELAGELGCRSRRRIARSHTRWRSEWSRSARSTASRCSIRPGCLCCWPPTATSSVMSLRRSWVAVPVAEVEAAASSRPSCWAGSGR